MANYTGKDAGCYTTMRCKPCRVTMKAGPDAGKRYEIQRDGTVTQIFPDNMRAARAPEAEEFAKEVRAEAARQRRNRNARERHEALTGLGLTRVRGAQGGIYYE